MISSELIEKITRQYVLPLEGTHGISHWARVLENGRILARRTGAVIEVVELFAVFHDAERENEGWDSDHGLRGAEFAARLRGEHFDLLPREFDLLFAACSDHTRGKTTGDVTLRTCWDADRLDLGRVGIAPDVQYLCTEPAKEPATLSWADQRGRTRFIPPLIREEWGLDIPEK